MKIEPSTRKDKRFSAVFKNGSTYIDHHDKIKRDNYIKRHSKLYEYWDDPYSAGSLSRYLLWGDHTSLNDNHQAFMKRFFS